jgi:hypothetical protein
VAISIADDDSASLPVVTIIATDDDASEAGPDIGRFTITRTGSTDDPLTVLFTVSGSATMGADYDTFDSYAIIPIGESSITIDVTPIVDNDFEETEDVILTLAFAFDYGIGADWYARVEITEAETNAPPVAVGDSYFVAQIGSTSLQVAAVSGVLANDSDPENDSLTASVLVQPSSGAVVMQSDGSFTYTPTSGSVEAVAFIYRVTDSEGGYSDATVNIFVGSDLDIVDPAIPESDEVSPGAFVPLSTEENRIGSELYFTALDSSFSTTSFVLTFDDSVLLLWHDSALSDPITSGVTTFSAISNGTVFAEVIAAEVNSLVTLNWLDGSLVVLAQVSFTGIAHNLSLSSGKAPTLIIPEDKEISPGAIVLLNNDDDDEDGFADFMDDEVNGNEAEKDFHKFFIQSQPKLKGQGNYMLSFDGGINIRTLDGVLVSETTEFAPENKTILYVEGIGLSDFIGQERIKLKFKPKAGPLSGVLDEVAYTVVKFDLIVSTVGLGNIPGDDFSEFLEDTRGAYVPQNNDHDEYKLSSEGDKLTLLPDVLLAKGSAEENDLLKFRIEQGLLDLSGTFNISISRADMDTRASKIRLWNTAQRGSKLSFGEISPDVPFWVEGVNVGSEELFLWWENDVQIVRWADSVKVNVFGISGPLNVPVRSEHTYVAAGGAEGGRSKWLDQSSGGAATTISSTVGNDTLLQKWGAEKSVGLITYQADDDFIWQREVNVVDVSLTTTTNTITTSSEGLGPVAGANNHIASRQPGGGGPNNGLAMLSRIEVFLEGPTRGGVERGTHFIDVGIIQIVDIGEDDWQTVRNSDGAIMRSRLVGKKFIDMVTDENFESQWPWYDSQSMTSDNGRGARLKGTDLDNPIAHTAVLSMGDRPHLPISLGPITFAATSTLIIKFDMYVAARTADVTHGSVQVKATSIYTSLATASWQFDGSGTYDAMGVWTHTGTGNTMAGGGQNGQFEPDNSGAPVPIPPGGNANTTFRKQRRDGFDPISP